MGKIKVLVVEDEIIIADNICDTLEDLGFETIEPAINYTEALALIETKNPDIAILDIQLSGKKTGIDLAKKINEDYNFPFVFLTSNSDNVTLNQAKKVMPHAYLVKPFSKEELYTTVEIVLNNFLQKKNVTKNNKQILEDALFIKVKDAMVKLAFNDILYLKSAHVYVEIVLKNKKTHLVRASLNDMLNKLNNTFIQVHRSYIINLSYIEQIHSNALVIQNKSIPVSKKYKELLFKHINLVTSSK
ncbi:LytTR family two component transcriptional regulator [Jejuia pallidilutea]|uniref:LytTR family two component transcriptional regulator n=1 Tax=Jejuia pallidilutea TaxID=504487 RepID=A0A362X5Q3_9FLAO|nr:response regulator [Jejuia pallidilutea]PQV48161.1 LytTR family two component transcriptional regulator [Jejuia pallidilutea]